MSLSLLSRIYSSLKSRSKPSPPLPKAIWTNPLYFMAFGLGSGAIPVAPGTFATLFAIPIYLLLRPLPLVAYLLFVIGFIIFSSWLSDRISRETNTHDHPGMCIDEFVGFFVTMIHAPRGWWWILLGFVLFRLFDIWKPWPINIIDEKVHGGWGMIFDDVVAGLFAMILIQLIAIMT